jgi:anti-anti-sigma factor
VLDRAPSARIAIRDEAGARVVAVVGDHDLHDVPAFNRHLSAAAAEAPTRPIVVDLSRATFLDSRMLGAVLGWLRSSAETGGPPMAVVTGQSPTPVEGVLRRLVGGEVLPLHRSVAEAAAALASR